MSTTVVFESDHMLVAGKRIPIRDVGAHGEMQIGGAGGPILRPLSYGERTRIVLRAMGARHAVESVSGAVLRAALVQAGECERLSAEILALVLAGAECDAPTFADTALTVARAAGWSIRQINEAEADEIDRLVMALGGTATPRADDGWHRIVFTDDAAATSLAGARRDLAERLIARAESAPATQPVGEADEADMTLPSTPFEASSRSGSPRDDAVIAARATAFYSGDPETIVDAQGEVNAPGMASQQRDASYSAGASRSDVGAGASPASQPPSHIPASGFAYVEGPKRALSVAPRPHGEGQEMRTDRPDLQKSPIPHTGAATTHVPDARRQSWRVRADAQPDALSAVSPSGTADVLPEPSERVTDPRGRHPLNRVSYHPHPGAAAVRVGRGGAAAAAQEVGIRGESHPSDLAPALPGAPAASVAPHTVPVVLTLAPSTLGQRGDTHAAGVPGVLHASPDASAAQVTERVSTLAQMAQLVGDEVADTLAALLQHEADLRGIEP